MGLPAAGSQTATASRKLNFLHLQTPVSFRSLFGAPGDVSKVELSQCSQKHAACPCHLVKVLIFFQMTALCFSSTVDHSRITSDFKPILKNLNKVFYIHNVIHVAKLFLTVFEIGLGKALFK